MDVAVAYWEHPSKVLWVDLGHRRLQGFDNYWHAGNRYGAFQDPENIGTLYDPAGITAFALELLPDGTELELTDTTPPADATILEGFMVPDTTARALGIL